MGKTAAIQLSANFVVVLVISIVLFCFALFFFSKIWGLAEKTNYDMEQHDQQMLRDLLSSGERVAVFPAKATASWGNPATFNIGIMNIFRERQVFAVYIRFSVFFDEEQREVCTSSPCQGHAINEWLETAEEKGTENPVGLLREYDGQAGNHLLLPANGNEEFLLLITPEKGAPKGIYVFDLIVAYDRFGAPPPPFDNPDGVVDCRDATHGPMDAQELFSCLNDFAIGSLYDGQIHKIYVEVS